MDRASLEAPKAPDMVKAFLLPRLWLFPLPALAFAAAAAPGAWSPWWSSPGALLVLLVVLPWAADGSGRSDTSSARRKACRAAPRAATVAGSGQMADSSRTT